VSCDGRGCGRGFGLRGWRVRLVMYVWLGVAECDGWLGVWLVAGGWWLVVVAVARGVSVWLEYWEDRKSSWEDPTCH
jgi:hypothetical protein